MPIFEYQCRACGNQFEYLVLPTTPGPTCPSCKSPKLEQLVSLFGTTTEHSERSHMREIDKKRKEYKHDQAQREQRLRNED